MEAYKFCIKETAIAEDFRFSCRRGVLDSSNFIMHTHDCLELSIVVNGSGTHIAETEEYGIEAGDIFVIHKGQAHGFKDMKNAEIVNLMYVPSDCLFDNEELQRMPGYKALFALEPIYRKSHAFKSRLRLLPPQLRDVSVFLEKIEKEQREKKAGHKAAISGIFLELIVCLSRRYSEEPRTDSQASLLEIASVINHMEEHFAENLPLILLAEKANMSVNNFLRVFKKATGFSPVEYVIRLRINHACKLLISSACPISSAAFESGFEDSNYFSRQFRKITGLSAREFRSSAQALEIKAGIFIFLKP